MDPAAEQAVASRIITTIFLLRLDNMVWGFGLVELLLGDWGPAVSCLIGSICCNK
jgi:hypothetical protein